MSPHLTQPINTSVLLAGYLYLKLLRNRTALVFTTSLLHSPPNITKAISDIIDPRYEWSIFYPTLAIKVVLITPPLLQPDLEGQHSIRALQLKLVQNES
jgi:hypothetical protein